MKKQKEKIIKKCSCRKKYTLPAWKELKYIGEMTGVDGDVWEMRDCVCESTLMIQISQEETMQSKKIKIIPKQKELLKRELKARMKIRNKRLEERRQHIYK